MRTCLEIDRKVLQENIKTLIAKNGNAFFCPVLKANAYGFGALEVAKTIHNAGVKKVAVSSFEEALKIKDLSDSMEIYVLGPFPTFDRNSIKIIDLHRFIPVIGKWEDLKVILNTKKKSINFHLKFNTGMNRFGFPPSEKHTVLNFIKKHSALKLKGIASHLSQGEQAGLNNNWTHQQIQSFKDLLHYFQQALSDHTICGHLLNSAAWLSLLSHSQPDFSLGFRPGMCMYGIKPPLTFTSQSAKENYQSLDLKPTYRLISFVVHSLTLPPKQPVSYGNTWTTKKPSTLAIVSMGYADGLPYLLFNKGEVLFRGNRVPIVGHIYMDFFTIDVSSAAQEEKIKNGEEVVICGQQKKNFIPIEEHSEKLNSVPEEILTHLGQRVCKIYKN